MNTIIGMGVNKAKASTVETLAKENKKLTEKNEKLTAKVEELTNTISKLIAELASLKDAGNAKEK